MKPAPRYKIQFKCMGNMEMEAEKQSYAEENYVIQLIAAMLEEIRSLSEEKREEVSNEVAKY